MHAVPIALVITDIHGDIQMVNAAFESMTGWRKEDVIGKKTSILKSGEHPESFYRQLWETIVSGETWKGELVNLRRDGSTYIERMVITPVRSSDGNSIEYFVALKEDITAVKEEERLRQRSQRLESIGQMTGGIAHDLNNILTPIMMTMDLLDKDLSPQDYEKTIEMVRKNCDRAKKIISQLLTFSRGEDHESTSINLRLIIKDLISLIKETFPRTIKIKMNIPSNTWLTNGDVTQLHQVFLNFAVNARDAMPDGGELTFEAKNVQLDSPLQYLNQTISSGNYVHLTVKDTGIGIPSEHLENVFDPFFTTKDEGKGTGLGLSIALGIVRSHGGLIIPESKVGQGTVFEIYLPAILESSFEHLLENDGAPLNNVPIGHNETILIVDDEEAILQVVSSILIKHGYQVIEASSAIEALVLFVQSQTSIAGVISDLTMPDMDGLTLVEALQKVKNDVKIIVSTGFSGSSADRKFTTLQSLGVTTILKKPYSAQELLRSVAIEFFERY